jgi:hypothetical protein
MPADEDFLPQNLSLLIGLFDPLEQSQNKTSHRLYQPVTLHFAYNVYFWVSYDYNHNYQSKQLLYPSTALTS